MDEAPEAQGRFAGLVSLEGGAQDAAREGASTMTTKEDRQSFLQREQPLQRPKVSQSMGYIRNCQWSVDGAWKSRGSGGDTGEKVGRAW